MNRVKLVPTIIVKYGLRFFYSLFCVFCKRDDAKITFASYRSDRLKDNLYYIYKQIEKDYPLYKRYGLFQKLDSSPIGKLTYIFHMIHACYHLATSKYFIVDDYYFPIYVLKPSNDVQIIQLWHSAGALKKFGLSTVGKPFGPSDAYLKHVNIHGNYTKTYVSSKEVVPFFAEAFNIPKEHIYPLGVPRTDYLFSEETANELRQNFYKSYPELRNKKLLLYAPTYRGKSHFQETFECPFNIEKMEENLTDSYALLIHLHPYMQDKLKLPNQSKFTYHIYHTYTIQELLILTDVLITDYSTVFFDFSLLKRPMIFYPYDLASYKQERDFYYEYEDLVPGPIATDTDRLIELISEVPFDPDVVNRFSQRFFDYRDGKASERIVGDIMGK